ncbi:D-alanyl-D-alanine endopeptidase [Glaciimonas immobilis]|uniref:D-alanyl-D-alanine endopeptidase (Penicillin-binding protein 7) n=1 Tax=Glaciimonas immobilis TaxID=728004 RepID=A0A840RXV9_9BURK|nr:D-alanyl-D-alanine endopeptidase [Glaciimonas immobilis]KAF3996426.1 D-alanyl-D-alanine endopeptidase [Glaciimonas immobilis]MBB5201239.1 D-alanyl-D-alanine endopeptidase (penicillin-binding protein 7) [Glaciimonas immobilis]
MAKTALVIILSLFFVVATASAAPGEDTNKAHAGKATTSKTVKSKTGAGKKTVAVRSRHAKNTKGAIASAPGKRERVVGKKSSRQNNLASLEQREGVVRKVVYVHGRRKVVFQRTAYVAPAVIVPAVLSAGEIAGLNLTRDPLELKSNVALVLDQTTGQVLFDKNSQVSLPIASLTKLMTSMVVVEAHQDMNEVLSVTDDDIDREKHSSSRLRVGSQLSRTDMLHIALMSSENRAASALGRNYPGGLPAFVVAMNAKAKSLGMTGAHYVDSTGLSHLNVASARDLAKLVIAAYQHPIIRQYSTDSKYLVEPGGRPLQYNTSNHLVENPGWQIGLQKTGYINEAGRCMVMQTNVDGRGVVMVFLDSRGKYSRQGDADRMKKWLAENTSVLPTNTGAKIASGQS